MRSTKNLTHNSNIVPILSYESYELLALKDIEGSIFSHQNHPSNFTQYQTFQLFLSKPKINWTRFPIFCQKY